MYILAYFTYLVKYVLVTLKVVAILNDYWYYKRKL